MKSKIKRIFILSIIGMSSLAFAGCAQTKQNDANSRTNNTSKYVNTHAQNTQYFSSMTYDKIHNRLIFYLKPQYNNQLRHFHNRMTIRHAAHIRCTQAKLYAHNPALKFKIIRERN